ncbi:hypothetical protein Dimus_020330 [Dionaea muscipula]
MEAEREMKVRGRKEEGGERPCALEFADFAAVLERGPAPSSRPAPTPLDAAGESRQRRRPIEKEEDEPVSDFFNWNRVKIRYCDGAFLQEKARMRHQRCIS